MANPKPSVTFYTQKGNTLEAITPTKDIKSIAGKFNIFLQEGTNNLAFVYQIPQPGEIMLRDAISPFKQNSLLVGIIDHNAENSLFPAAGTPNRMKKLLNEPMRVEVVSVLLTMEFPKEKVRSTQCFYNYEIEPPDAETQKGRPKGA